MKTILFPTDYSAESLHAAQYTAMIAKRLDAKIVILHSYSIPTPIISEYQLPFDFETNNLKIHNDAEEGLQFFTTKLLAITDFPLQQITQMVENGFIAETVIDIAKKINADLIMMGTKGASNFIERWVGTNAENVVEGAECPVWIIPGNAKLILPQTMLYAADLKDDEFKETRDLLQIAKKLGATCELVHIHEDFELDINGSIYNKIKHLEDAFFGDDITFNVINHQEIELGLDNLIKSQRMDVLVLSVTEKTFFDKLFESSISKHFVFEARLPILIFRK